MTKLRTFCTVATNSYLPQVRVLARSLRRHHPGARVFFLLADKKDERLLKPDEPFELIELAALGDFQTIERMCFYYTAFELCNALKPFLHEYILSQTDADEWIYFDSDIRAFQPLDPVFADLQGASILLRPHATHPVPDSFSDLNYPAEAKLLQWGIYNGGFLGLRRSEEAREFVAWWKKHLIHDCYHKQWKITVDQLWLNLVPHFFKNCATCVHPGANVAYWNLHEGTFEKHFDGTLLFNGSPLLFFHYSGWRIDDKDRVSRHSRFFDSRTVAHWSEISDTYARELLENGYEALQQCAYGFANFDDGYPIPLRARREYLALVKSGEAENFAPFSSRVLLKRMRRRRLLQRSMKNLLPAVIRRKLARAA
ncbi:MAG TPA: hypothetical protein VMJ32_07230 [Pirellulales bacterium]|nr:hypothetical protein [Pirellulales bacterium]